MVERLCQVRTILGQAQIIYLLIYMTHAWHGHGTAMFVYQHTHVKVVLPLCHLPLNPRGRKQFDYHGGIVNPQPAVLAMAAYMARPGSRDQGTYLTLALD